MLTVTEAASERLARMLEDVQAEDGIAVRLATEEQDGISVLPGKPKPGDTVFECEGRVVLVVDEETASELTDYILDVSAEESGLSLRPLD